MRAKQTRLRDLVRTETNLLSPAVTLPTAHTLTVAHTLPPWGSTIPTDKPEPGSYPFNRWVVAQCRYCVCFTLDDGTLVYTRKCPPFNKWVVTQCYLLCVSHLG